MAFCSLGLHDSATISRVPRLGRKPYINQVKIDIVCQLMSYLSCTIWFVEALQNGTLLFIFVFKKGINY